MAKYRIHRQAVFVLDFDVEAESPAEAIQKVLDGEGKRVGEPRYNHSYSDLEEEDVTNLDTGQNGYEEVLAKQDYERNQN